MYLFYTIFSQKGVVYVEKGVLKPLHPFLNLNTFFLALQLSCVKKGVDQLQLPWFFFGRWKGVKKVFSSPLNTTMHSCTMAL